MKFLANLAIRAFLIWLFAHFGWMTFSVYGAPLHGFGWHLLFALIGGILLSIIGVLVTLALLIPLAAATVVSLGLALLFVETIIYSVTLWLISLIFDANVLLHGFWYTVLCAFLLSVGSGLVRTVFDDSNS